MSKKNNRRSKQKYPALDVSYNLKSRRDYLDNHYYVNGVLHKEEMVIPALDEKTKKYLNDFNEEYYNSSFDSKYDYDNIHKCEIDKDTVEDLKAQMRAIKKLRQRIFNLSPNTITEELREEARLYTEQIEAIDKFIDDMHPRRKAERANNRRNDDVFNIAKATNSLKSWEVMKEEELKGYTPEIIVMLKEEIDEDLE